MAERVLDDYVAAWNESDPVARRDIISRALTDDFELTGLMGTISGHTALERLIDALQQRMPGGRIVRTGAADATGEHLRFGWEIRSATGATVMAGTDVAEVGDDGRLRRVEVINAPVQ